MPWPNVAELESVLPHEYWTLVGGLMTQLHCIHRGLDVIRPTNDVDVVLHVETTRGVTAMAVAALESLGYELMQLEGSWTEPAHRFRRDKATVDLLTSASDVVDVLVADHAAPRVVETLRGRAMVAIEGGTQALRRTMNAHLMIEVGVATVVSVPEPFAAVVLKAAAYRADTRDRERHLSDAAALLCCIEDPHADRDQFIGSDRARIKVLRQALPDNHPAWRALPTHVRTEGQAALRILYAP